MSISNIPQIRINAASGLAYENDVQSYLETQFDPTYYEIIRNKSLRDPVTFKTLRIDGKYVRPDFQVVNRATGRLAAIYEAKTGTIDYLSGPGSAKIFVYNRYADAYTARANMASGSVPTEAVYDVAETAAERPMGAAMDSVLGKATAVLAVVGVAQALYQMHQQQSALAYLQTTDPVYYEQLMCQAGAYACA
jgi:hypothetical protein